LFTNFQFLWFSAYSTLKRSEKMASASRLSKIALAALALSLLPAPAVADVKSGVDAWSRGEYEAAVKQWRDPAIKGDADAQFNMGQAYKMGRGVKTDLNVALDWYRKASAQGHLQAGDSYGHLLHYQGKIAESIPYLQASSDRGDPRAQYLLATELFNGVHIPKDWVRSYALMTRASSAGMTPASRSLAQMDEHIPLEQRQAATVLAGELEQRASKARAAQVAGFPINTTPPPKPAKPVSVPPSNIPPGFPSDIPVAGNAAPKPAPAKPAPVKVAAPKPTPAKVASADGPWRIQLGAFGEEANAKKLWTSLENRIPALAPLQPYLKAAGNVTRLQAGPFASKSAADAMCNKVKAAGEACLAVPR
jgi:TPR repeat protein